MPNTRESPLIRFIRRIAASEAAKDSDTELLQRFVARRDEAAFAALLRRHGPMVLSVCRRVLNDPHDAEDAFQATFLVLVRKADAVAKPELLANWLYGVAYRTAVKARTSAFRRRTHERQAAMIPASEPRIDAAWEDVGPVLDDEINRLTDKLRTPLVLCYLQGKTREEAARQLGWTPGMVKGRLEKARGLLKTRLVGRGVAVSAGMLATLVSEESALAATVVPAALIDSTIKAGCYIAAGNAVAGGAVSAHVAALTEGVLKAMLLTKLKIASLVLLTVAVAGTGVAGGMIYRTQAVQPNARQLTELTVQASSKPQRAAERARDKGQEAIQKELEKLQGTWIAGEPDKQLAEGDTPCNRLVISGNQFVWHHPIEKNPWKKGKFEIDPSKQPRTMDMSFDRDGKPAIGKCIYEMNGDMLKLCCGEPDRPTEFKTKPDSEQWLYVWKREKPASEPKDDVKARVILERMAKAYADCKSYSDSGVVKTVFFQADGKRTVNRPFETAFVYPDRFRFEYRERKGDEEENRYIIWRKRRLVQTWWDVRPGIEKPKSLGLALGTANGVSGGSSLTIPALLHPGEFGGGGKLENIADATRAEDGKLDKVECFRVQGKYGNHPITVWIDKKSYLVRRIDEQVKFDKFRTEETTTYDPTIDEKIPDKMLEFDPPMAQKAFEKAAPPREKPEGGDQVKDNATPKQEEDKRSSWYPTRIKSIHNLRVIGIAMHNYHADKNSFPPAAIYSNGGNPLLSWRVMLLPYLEQDALYQQFRLDEPWDSEHNKKLLSKMPDVFKPLAGKAEKYSTFYQVITGEGTVFEGKDGIRIKNIKDGTSNTILAVEAGEAVPWTKPADLLYFADKPLPKLGGLFKKGFYVVTCDGATHFVDHDCDAKLLRAAITRAGRDPFDLKRLFTND